MLPRSLKRVPYLFQLPLPKGAKSKEVDHSDGYLQYSQKENGGINIDSILSNKKGFGISAMASITSLSFRSGQGDVSLIAIRNSHTFYLMMGMIPVDHELNYIDACYGLYVYMSLARFIQKEPLTLEEDHEISALIRAENNISEDVEITKVDMEKYRIQLTQLFDKKISTRTQFIMMFLTLLERDIELHYVDTKILGETEMQMSEAGKDRWRNALKTGLFELFKNFDHLRPCMNDSQMKKLDEILEKRANI